MTEAEITKAAKKIGITFDGVGGDGKPHKAIVSKSQLMRLVQVVEAETQERTTYNLTREPS